MIDFKNPTEADIELLKQTSKDLSDAFLARLAKAIPADMNAVKIMDRATLLFSIMAPTRTSVLGALSFSTFNASMVGVERAAMHKIVDAAFDVCADNPVVKQVAAQYLTANTEAQIKQFTGADKLTLN